MIIFLSGFAFAQSWTVLEGSDAVASCVGPTYIPGILGSSCPKYINTSSAVDAEGNVLFVWEQGPYGSYSPGLGLTFIAPQRVEYRYFDTASGSYTGSGSVEIGSVDGEGHSPSVAWVPNTPAGSFAITKRTVHAGGGRVHQQVTLTDPGGVATQTSRLIDPDGRLCTGCDHGTSQLLFDAVADRLRWVFTWQHPNGSANEEFDEAYGSWVGPDDVAWDSDNLYRVAGDFPSAPGTGEPLASCAELEAEDGAPISANACFDPAALSDYDAQHHPHLSLRWLSGLLVSLWMDWSYSPKTVLAGFQTAGGATLTMLLPSAPPGQLGKAAEAVGTVGTDAYFHAAWKQRALASLDTFTDVMYRYCTGSNADCGAGLGFGHWVPDSPTALPTSLYQVDPASYPGAPPELRNVNVVGVVSTPPVAPSLYGAVYVAFESLDWADPLGPAVGGNYSQVYVTTACLNHGSPAAPLVWSTPTSPDPLQKRGDSRTFGSRTFDKLLVDPVNERVILSWIATDEGLMPDEPPTHELRWAHAAYRSCGL